MERPMHRMLRRGTRRVSLHMPATGGRAPFGPFNPYRLDTTELAVTDDLYRPKGAIVQAQALAAKSAGAAHAFLLHGGSTAGVHAMLLYAARRGEEVILPRNCHLSALNLCALAGLEPVFAEVSYTAQGRPYTSLQAYERAMEGHPRAKAVLAVRPDYYGLMPDLRALAQEAHARHMLLLCDEAHGATFNWRQDVESALAQGADLAAQSAHKTLPALTAGAWLHAAKGIDIPRLGSLLPMVQTSSPSFVNLLSLDEVRAWMDRYGEAACKGLGEALRQFYEKAGALGYARAQEDAPPGFAYDPLRLVLAAPQGGYALGEALEKAGIDMEMCDESCVVGILPLYGYQRVLGKLLAALRRISRSFSLTAHSAVNSGSRDSRPFGRRSLHCRSAARLKPHLLLACRFAAGPTGPTLADGAGRGLGTESPTYSIPPSVAAFAPREFVPVGRAAGRVSAVSCGLYPPGVALVAAGERVTAEMAEFLSRQDTGRLFGLTEEGMLTCVAEALPIKE